MMSVLMTEQERRGAVLIATVLTFLLGLAVVAVPPAQGAAPLVHVTSKREAFSPNGDGHKDTLPLRFRLTERADVSVRIARVGAVDLGTLGPGVHRWEWRGQGAPTGYYRLTVVARTDAGKVGRDRWFAELDRGEEIAKVKVSMTRRTLYPDTPGKTDEIWVHSTHSGNATEVTVRDAAGDVVVEDRLRQWWSWDGSGLPAGEYVASFSVKDLAGNRRTLERPITISTEHLRQETWTGTYDAADLERFESCGTSPSTRFPDGVAVTATDGCQRSAFVPRFPIPVAVDPDVEWRLTATGAGDRAQVYISDGIDVVPTPTAEGEGTTTSPWGAPYFTEWAREPEPTGWVAMEEGAYDVAELTFEVRYWTASDAAAPTAASTRAQRAPVPSPATAPSR